MNRYQWAGLLFTISAGIYFMMKISQAGINKIKRDEALRLAPYKDEGGKWSIGYGHLLLPGEWYDRIDEPKAEQLLRQDLAIAEKAVNNLVKVPLTQSQYDALVSFVYNVGSGNFKGSRLLTKLNLGDYAGAAQEFPNWKYVGDQESDILIARRAREQQLFLTA